MKIYRTVCFASLLLVHSLVHATSFDCSKGRSVTEQMICHHADLSKLDDQLGKLYWQARRRVSNPKAFRADSDSNADQYFGDHSAQIYGRHYELSFQAARAAMTFGAAPRNR